MFDLDYLRLLRLEEMRRILPLLPVGARVLEIGAGPGEQAKVLVENGFDVVAIDLPGGDYSGHRSFPVMDYDGVNIPLETASVDAIFSSNVLEHVDRIADLFAEMRRVLRPTGIGIHAMPTPAWRLATFATGVPTALAAAARLVPQLVSPPPGQSRKSALLRNAKTALGGVLPLGHGTSPEGLSELVTFSRARWRRTFARNGFTVEREIPIRLAYSGHMVFGPRLSFARRERLSRYVGSAAYIYVVRASSSR